MEGDTGWDFIVVRAQETLSMLQEASLEKASAWRNPDHDLLSHIDTSVGLAAQVDWRGLMWQKRIPEGQFMAQG